jgi:hypothetical protein
MREITETSKNIYNKNIIRLNDGEPIKNYNFLKNTNEIFNKINHLKPNSQRTYLISIVSTLKNNKNFEKCFKIYFNKMMEFNKELKINNTKSENQKENWITQNEIIKIFNDYYDKIKPIFKLKKVNEREWELLLDFVILSLYVLQPPRRNKDYQLMKVIKSNKDLNAQDYKNYNYCNIDENEFLFFNYKTNHTYKLQEIKINDDLKYILTNYLKFHPLKKNKNFFLLVNFDGSPLEQINSITRILNKIFNKKIGVSMLRNIYLTDTFKKPMEILKDTANKMGTSSGTIQNNYIKIDEK